MKNVSKILSKSKLIRSYRCIKAFYMTVHHPERETKPDEALKDLFAQGTLVGEQARKLFPDGALIDNPPWEFSQSVKKTKDLIDSEQTTIYEAAFMHEKCYAKMDIINYSKKTKKWSLYEVKSSTRVKDEHLHDLALQSWIIAKSGLPIDKIHLVHINRECVFPKLDNLFTVVDVTEEMRDRYFKVQPHLEKSFEELKNSEVPNVKIGEHCSSPGDCGFKNYCWVESEVPEVSTLNLPVSNKWDYFHQGIVEPDDDRLLSTKPELKQQVKRMVECHLKKETYSNAKSINKVMETWKYPLIFLDFETIAFPIPRFKGCSPYNQVPFQFSVHILNEKGGSLTHHEFLHTDGSDPRPELIEELLKVCEGKGNLVAYYATFENKVLSDLAKDFPKHAKSLLALMTRMKDPLPILRDHFYDPKFNFSYSLKSVAPALLGDDYSYDSLDVGDGYAAQRAYKKLISDEISEDDKKQIRKNLLDYCAKDTLALAEIVKLMLEWS